jgi:BTB/POZ domain-containing protein 3/6
MSLTPAALSRLLSCDYLYIDSEQDLFDASVQWATKRAINQNGDITDADLRKHLGDNLGKIRFASMTAADFAKTLGKRGILTDAEKSLFYYYLLTGGDSHCLTQLGFDLMPRVSKCIRYPCLGRTAGWWTCNGPGDAISFAVNKPVTLVGVAVYNSREPSLLHVTLELWRNPDVLLKRTEHSIISDGKENPCPVYLGGAGVDLDPDESYTVLTMMRGPIAYYGQGGVEIVVAMGVTFTFSRSEKSGNGTNVKSGQIPELLFLPRVVSPTEE